MIMKTINPYTLLCPLRRSALFLMLLLNLAACESFVELELPDDQLYGAGVFNDYTTASAALTDIYAGYRDNTLLTGNTEGISYLLGHYADELDLYTSSLPNVEPFNTNSLLPGNPYLAIQWNNSYNLIFAANSILEAVPSAIDLTPEQQNQLLGEALFNRALIHFYLTQLYGAIPYLNSTDYETNRSTSRMEEAEVYQRCIEDLTRAKALLPEAYTNASRTRPNKWTCTAVLARVYLYTENWEQAAEEAGAVLAQQGYYTLNPELDDVFLVNSRETLWQLAPNAAGGNTTEGPQFIFSTAPPPDSALSTVLLNAFENGDQREQAWVQTVTGGTNSYAFAYKYKQNTNTTVSLEHSIVLRLAEVYLIRAEAYARLNRPVPALADLNAVRQRAGLTPLAGLNGTALLDAVVQERRVELFTELGHRFFDLKRFDRLDAVLGLVKTNWDATDRIFPIPQNELELNPNLRPQNEGY